MPKFDLVGTLVLTVMLVAAILFAPWQWAFLAALVLVLWLSKDYWHPSFPRWALAIVFVFLWWAPGAFAADAVVASAPAISTGTVVDFSAGVNAVIGLVLAAVGGFAVSAIKRGVVLLQSMHIMNASQIHQKTIDDFTDKAAAWAQAQLEAIIDPLVRVQMKSPILAKAAQMVADQAPQQIAAVGLTPAGVKAAIETKLTPVAADPAATAAAAAAPLAA
jgi:hypothetical protein